MNALKSYSNIFFDLHPELSRQAGGSLFERLEKVSSALIGNPETVRFWKNPQFSDQEKITMLKEFLGPAGLGEGSTKFLTVIFEKGRIFDLPEILKSAKARFLEKQNILPVQVLFPYAPEVAEVDAVRTALEKRFGSEISTEIGVDPELIAGIVFRAQGKTYDYSVLGKLKQVKARLLAKG